MNKLSQIFLVAGLSVLSANLALADVFTIKPRYYNQDDHSGNVSDLCLDSTETHYENSNAIVYPCHGGDNQKWIVMAVEGSPTFVTIKPVSNTSLCLVPDALGGWAELGVNVRLQADDGACASHAASWLKIPTTGGGDILYNVGTVQYLSISHWKTVDENTSIQSQKGKNVEIADGSACIAWELVPETASSNELLRKNRSTKLLTRVNKRKGGKQNNSKWQHTIPSFR